jgi:nucleoside-diphosphate-sugar epimerase
MTQETPLKVHVTGAYGLIGNLVYRHLSAQQDRYDVYGSGRRIANSDRISEEAIIPIPADHFTIADLSDAGAVSDALQGMDAVIHLGAVPDPGASFEDVLSSNVTGTYNVLEACRKAGINRLVYASSIMVSWGYAQYEEPYVSIREGRIEDLPDPIPPITISHLPRPTEPYSASKVWAEGFCRTYADAHGISTVCVRIGWVNKENAAAGPFSESIWCSHQDIVHIIELALKATASPVFEICYGVTDSTYRWVDLDHSRERLGYVSRG